MEEDGTEPRPGIIAGQGRRETRQEKMEEDGTEPRPGIIAGLPRQEKMEEDGTEPRPGIIAGQGRGDGQDRRRWRRMVQNPDLAS